MLIHDDPFDERDDESVDGFDAHANLRIERPVVVRVSLAPHVKPPVGMPNPNNLTLWLNGDHGKPPKENKVVTIRTLVSKLEKYLRYINHTETRLQFVDGNERNKLMLNLQRLHGMINQVCNTLRKCGADPNDACNIVAPKERTNNQKKQEKIERNVSDISSLCLHCSTYGDCTLPVDCLFDYLVDSVEHACIGSKKAAWPISNVKHKKSIIPQASLSDPDELLIPCQCTRKTQSGKEIQCGKMMLANDQAFKDNMTTQEWENYVALCREKTYVLLREKYSDEAILTCMVCTTSRINSIYILSSKQKSMYSPNILRDRVYCTECQMYVRTCNECKNTNCHVCNSPLTQPLVVTSYVPEPPKPYEHPKPIDGMPGQMHVFFNGKHIPYSR